jgi:hypothetical protein
MNPVLWGIVVVLLLGLLIVVTMSKTKWKRTEPNASADLRGNKGRVSGGDD